MSRIMACVEVNGEELRVRTGFASSPAGKSYSAGGRGPTIGSVCGGLRFEGASGCFPTSIVSRRRRIGEAHEVKTQNSPAD